MNMDAESVVLELRTSSELVDTLAVSDEIMTLERVHGILELGQKRSYPEGVGSN